VVFTVVKKEEKQFIPPKAVDRPKMKLRKPKVKVKKTSKPKPTTRIVTKVNRASMPDIQLPEMSGMGEALVGGIGGFEMMPDLDEVTVFGSGQSIGNDFVGTFYDFKRDRRGKGISMDPEMFKDRVAKFIRGGWKESDLARYYRSPKTLYTTAFMVPTTLSSLAPDAFGEPDTVGYAWMVHYKGKIVHKTGGKFRFWGQGDDVLLVRVNGKMVLNGSIQDQGIMFIYSNWQNNTPYSQRYYMGFRTSEVGDWFVLEPGVPLDMEVVIGEVPGGEFAAMLVVEEDGVEYERGRQGNPILPIFTTAEPSLDMMDVILEGLVEGEASVTNAPVFNDYGSGSTVSIDDVKENPPPEDPPALDRFDAAGMRTWAGLNGRTLEAEYLSRVGRQVVLKTAKGKQKKILFEELSPEDQNYVELANPPKFNIDFTKQSSQRIIVMSQYNPTPPPRILNYVFGTKLKQTSSGLYSHELQIEFFAVGAELGGNNYILLDRQESTFIPTKENNQSHRFKGKSVELMDFVLDSQRRGKKYSGFLITITDERGKIIDYRASNEWLFENLDNLKKLPVGRYMDKTCTRVHPTSPKSNRY